MRASIRAREVGRIDFGACAEISSNCVSKSMDKRVANPRLVGAIALPMHVDARRVCLEDRGNLDA